MTMEILRRRRGICFATQVLAVAALTLSARAGVQEFEDEERPDWFAAASAKGTITTIGFNDLGPDVLVTEQYAHLGVHFTYLGNFTRGENFAVFPQDGWGLDGNEMVHLVFDEPQLSIATDHPGTTQIDLFEDGVLVYSSTRFGGSGAGRFGGILGIQFDEAIIDDPFDDNVALDDLHFVAVPTPSTVFVLATLFALPSRRRSPR